jgi:hypothetical protein
MWETLTFIVVLSLLASAGMSFFAFKLGQRNPRRVTTPAVVEEYQIEQQEAGGFPKLIVKFNDDQHKMHLFEFHPNYAHHFSDELVKCAARAVGPKTAASKA